MDAGRHASGMPSPFPGTASTALGTGRPVCSGTHDGRPNQLRHGYATKVRREHGLEAAQVLLGHSKADLTQIYAERNEALAVGIAAKIG